MAKHRLDAVWCLVMFDLPVLTAAERREANRFRHTLLDLGFCMVQLSVYAQYLPAMGRSVPLLKRVREALPRHGMVRVLHVTDQQWSSAMNFIGKNDVPSEEPPDDLMVF